MLEKVSVLTSHLFSFTKKKKKANRNTQVKSFVFYKQFQNIWKMLVNKYTLQNSYSISYLLVPTRNNDLHSDWTVTVKSPLLTASSMVTTQLINCVVTVLPAVKINNGNYAVTVHSLCSHCT